MRSREQIANVAVEILTCKSWRMAWVARIVE